jgi:hypothetical protein
LLEIAAAPLAWTNIAGRRRVALAQQPLGSAHADENSCIGGCHEQRSDLDRPFGGGLAHHYWHLDAHAGWTQCITCGEQGNLVVAIASILLGAAGLTTRFLPTSR